MKITIIKEYDVNNCSDCPHVCEIPSSFSRDDVYFKCSADSECRTIPVFGAWSKKDLEGIPEWCPFKNDNTKA